MSELLNVLVDGLLNEHLLCVVALVGHLDVRRLELGSEFGSQAVEELDALGVAERRAAGRIQGRSESTRGVLIGVDVGCFGVVLVHLAA